MAKEIQKNMAKASEQLVFAIHRYYGIQLGDEELNHIHDMYNISKENVESYYQVNAENQAESNIFEPLEPVSVAPAKNTWSAVVRMHRRYV